MNNFLIVVRCMSDYYVAMDLLANRKIPFKDLSCNGAFNFEVPGEYYTLTKKILSLAGFKFTLKFLAGKEGI